MSEHQEKNLDLLNRLAIYEHLIDKLDEGVHAVDENMITVIYNRKMSEIESMRSEDVLQKNLHEVFKFANAEESTLTQALKGKFTQSMKQTYFNNKGNEITTVNDTFPVIVNEKIIGAVEISRDVTKVERMIRENLLKKGDTRYTFQSIMGNSEAFQEVIENARRAARTSSSVLLIGETGTGKELFAQSIHNESHWSSGPFISQNCAALPDTLIESLLFGTKRGAFTGAVDRQGLFEMAEGGTLLLDEINSLSPSLQAKLLRVIQEKTVRRIGDTKEKEINIRIIATINEDPIDLIAENRLRKDLYYRLGVVSLFIPPLRERKDDIRLLTGHFLQKYNRLFHMQVTAVSDGVYTLFHEYDWPGNVRELEHVIEGAMNLMRDESVIQFEHLPAHIRRKAGNSNRVSTPLLPPITKSKVDSPVEQSVSFKNTINDYEKEYLQAILEKHKGNVSKAAKELQMSRQNLQYRLRKYQIQPKKIEL